MFSPPLLLPNVTNNFLHVPFPPLNINASLSSSQEDRCFTFTKLQVSRNERTDAARGRGARNQMQAPREDGRGEKRHRLPEKFVSPKFVYEDENYPSGC